MLTASNMQKNNFNINGLSDDQVTEARKRFGYNKLIYKNENSLIHSLLMIAKQPMVILLMVTSVIYLLSGDIGDGVFMVLAIVLVSLISLFQDTRSRNALDKLKDFTQPLSKVIRNGGTQEIKSEDLVVGDALLVEEGRSVAADGFIIHSNDFSVNEAILTGESLAVYKDNTKELNLIYSGTTDASGLAIATITAIGNETKLGKIGSSLETIKEEKTPLELQINNFVKKMVIVGTIVFLVVWCINYLHSLNVLDSLLKALTLAMSILPEEIPVAFTTFMALGAYRLMKLGIVVKQMKTVETLGSATVICTDKTGTITENKMSLAKLFVLASGKIFPPDDALNKDGKELIRTAMWASEPIPFDPMEIALHETYALQTTTDERPNYALIHEYPLGGKPPMMTHIFENQFHQRIVAAKGAPEAMMTVSKLTPAERHAVDDAIKSLAEDGYRVLGVGEGNLSGNVYPANQQEIGFSFKGLVAFYDPPKKNIEHVLKAFYAAGIDVKIITGDNAGTTTAIANQIGFRGADKSISGEELMKLSGDELKEKISSISIFIRMFPDAKLLIINTLKSNHQVVAMTGDGVNDGPALKAAHIGIAMGKKGTEIAKAAASLILVEDDLSKMVDAIAMGRRIYLNLKKAIQYIISIHIPIILTVLLPLAFGWIYPNIFTPIHIIFLELIMGPTCSIIYENEPMEKNAMTQKPRLLTMNFFTWKELTTSIVQGLVITAGVLFIYQYAVHSDLSESTTRSMVFATLITSNIFLTLVNRSFYYSILTTLKYQNNLVALIIGITILLTALLIYITPLANFFSFNALNLSQLLASSCTGLISVIWMELVKWKKRSQNLVINPN